MDYAYWGNIQNVALLLKQFWWSRVRTNINAYLPSFHDCCWPKAIIANSATLYSPLLKIYGTLNYITVFSEVQSYTIILVVVHLFTKMAPFILCRAFALEIPQLFSRLYFSYEILVNHVISDSGFQF